MEFNAIYTVHLSNWINLKFNFLKISNCIITPYLLVHTR